MSGFHDHIDDLAREIGLDRDEVAGRKAFLELGEADIAALQDVHALLECHRDAFSDRFYAHLASFPRLRALLGEGAEARLRHVQASYFSSLTTGEYGEAYIRERLMVGATHQRIGLDPKWYIGAYRKYLSELTAMLWDRLQHQPGRYHAAVDALLKIVCFDMGLALDTYTHASQRSSLQNQNYLEQVIDGMPAGLVVVDAELRACSVNPMMAGLLGLPDDALAERALALAELIPCPELAAAAKATLRTGAPHDNVLVTLDARADGLRYIDFNIRRTRKDGGHMLLLIGQDITFRRKARLRLQESEQFFRLTFNQAAVGIVLLAGDGRVLRTNSKMSQILGYTEIELLQRFFQQLTCQEDLPDELALIERLKAGEINDYHREKRLLRRDGTRVWVSVNVSAMRDANGNQRFICVIKDIQRQKQAEEALLRMANHDALTGLPNRVLMQDRLGQAIMHAHRAQRQVAVMFIDLDRFKHVNDSLGHDAGDQLIVEIARRLSSSLRESDTVARQGGDEFVVVLPDLAGQEDATKVARKLLGNLFQPVTLCGQDVFPSGSIGIAMYPKDGQDSATLLKCADSAMYGSKGQGGNHHSFYTAEMGAQAVEHLRMEGALQRALQRQEFLLYYQPVVDIGSGVVSGVEALLRWQPQDRPMVSPADFIPLAEETGLIVPIGDWVLETAMRQQVAWREAGLSPVRISVNLSARQFLGQDVAQRVAALLAGTGCDPAFLTLEITESVLMENPAAATETMGRLAAMGVQLAIDDFGTGYSSLASLKRFPIHSLKIDRSFVMDLTRDADDAAIVNAVIALAHSMKLNVIAEGVETDEQLAFLQRHGCDQMQGYCFSRPVEPGRIEAMLQPAKNFH
ncbi:EAL domain-containing protein [Massilia yuzhufengensis]|uniref:Diguanylate cyclase DosC n=1 Tax=Massilia yuzhufengensis TaxID=1164594 RepID=A0A1I1MI22_9BURK|nr:EAL domain-containing protein [Massilia yuzhufengensis]SFC85081.1 PAS domain S-box-containing protein/diguanylate cyclase (GGDEF) domain-containing protein [Massilia yuzhufengensis]